MGKTFGLRKNHAPLMELSSGDSHWHSKTRDVRVRKLLQPGVGEFTEKWMNSEKE